MECKVWRMKFGYEYYYCFMICEVLVEGLNIIQLILIWLFRICFEIFSVSFIIGYDFLLDFQEGVFIVCVDFFVNELQIEVMWCRFEEMMFYEYINYSLILKNKFNCQFVVLYIKIGEKNFFEVENFVK